MDSFIQRQNELREDHKESYRVKTTYCTTKVQALVFLLLFVILVPTLVFYLSGSFGEYKDLDKYTCSVVSDFRVPCGDEKIPEDDCMSLSCCFDPNSKECYHYIPSKYSYQYDEDAHHFNSSQKLTPFGTKATKQMDISINQISKNQVSIIMHPKNSPVKKEKVDGEKNYIVNFIGLKLMVEVFRKKSDELLLSTARGPLIVSETYWEWTIFLTDGYLFGLDRGLIQFNDTESKKFGITRVLYPNKNDQHSKPVFWAYKNGKFHSVMIKHDGPLEVTVLPGKLIVLRGLRLDSVELVLSLGPTPQLLREQQTSMDYVPPRWALQPHVCRRGNTLSIKSMVKAFELDEFASSYCIDQDLIMAAMIETHNKHIPSLQNLLTSLDSEGKRLVLSMPPHVIVSTKLYDIASDLGILYKYKDEVYVGQYLDVDVAYPDYSHPNIQQYMVKLHQYLKEIINVKISGFILSENWPTDESFEMKKTYFPYLTKSLVKAMSLTLPWNATNSNSENHLKLHNLYGSSHIEAFKTYHASIDSSVLIMSASESFGDSEPNAMESVSTSWDNLTHLIDNLVFHSIIGNHLVSLPVCGDTSSYNKDVQETLCIRWYFIAATMPMFRISSVQPWREPENLMTQFGTKFAEKAVNLHKMFEGYFYTLLSQGKPVLRPMFYDYYKNEETFSLNYQYMLGPDLLVAHPLSTDRRKIQVYLPSIEQAWYEFWSGELYNTKNNPWVEMDVTETDFLAFIIQGRIMIFKEDDVLNLLIALHTEEETAEGSILLGNKNWLFEATNSTSITITNIDVENCNDYILNNITLFSPNKEAEYYNPNIRLCKGLGQIEIDISNV